MLERNRSIFRNEALQRHVARQEATVFPRLVRPRGFAALWLVLALIIGISWLILSTKAPTYIPGVAVAVQRNGDVETVFAILLSVTDAGFLQPGKIVEVEIAKRGAPMTASIVEVEPAQIDLPGAMARFGLTAESCSTIQFPAAAAFAHPTTDALISFKSGRHNIAYQARIRHGARRAISYLLAAGDEAKK